MKKSLFVAIAITACLYGCGQQQNENEELHRQVIAIHDEVMPVMGKVKSLQENLSENARELMMEDSLMHQEKIRSLQTAVLELDEAYENMFVWMRQFQTDYEQMQQDEANLYLREQKEKVEKVNTDIKEALAKGEELIQ